MSIVWCGIIVCSIIYGGISGNMEQISSAAIEGAGAALELIFGIAGVMCLWCGIMELLEQAGALRGLARIMAPLLRRLFPSCRGNSELTQAISANAAANMLGLGNAATPLGLRAISLMDGGKGKTTDDMCRLVVINTASIQLIPTTVAALRASAGCATPLDILPAVWLTSILSVTVGIGATALLKRWWPD